MSEHSTSSSLKTYVAIWIALLVGTALTVYASGLDLGRFNAAVALVIATIKATLVALFFMHIKGSSRLLHLAALTGLLWLFLMIALTLSEIGRASCRERV